MRVVVRADASVALGTGHVMRCLTLAEQLAADGARVSFLCRQLPGNSGHLLEKRGYPIDWLALTEAADWETDLEASRRQTDHCDWLIVDHYGLDCRWESGMRSVARRLLVIDDLANRAHDCDMLLDQNLRSEKLPYAGLVPADCELLLGPHYALLRPEFARLRHHRAFPSDGIQRVLVFFGGSDPTNETAKAIEAIRRLADSKVVFEVVVGAANPARSEIEQACRTLPQARFHCQVSDMATLMAQCDLALGAGGSTTWERCCLGLPSLVVVVAENQAAIARECDAAGVATYLGTSAELTSASLLSALEKALSSPHVLETQARRGMNLVDGLGTQRVTRAMSQLSKEPMIQ